MHAASQALYAAYSRHDPHWDSVAIYLRGDELRGSAGVDRHIDRTGKRDWLNAGGVTLDTTTYKYNGSSFQFPGNNTSSCLATADTTDLALGTNNFTMELWFNSMLWPGGTYYPCLMSQRTTSTTNHGFTWYFGIPGTSGLGSRFSYSTTGGAATETFAPFTFALDTWYHVAISRVGTTLYHFVDGVEALAHNIGSSSIFNSSQVFKIGAFDSTTYDSYSLSYFFGWMSDIRFTNGVGRYSEDFTPPPRSFPNK